MQNPPESLQEADVLHARCAQIPSLLRQVNTLPNVAWSTWRHRRIVITGIGMSEGVGRLAAQLWSCLGFCARFVPISACMTGNDFGDILVVISQGLSPNAKLVLEIASQYDDGLMLTSCDASLVQQHGWPFDVITLPPKQESELLLRIQGPAVAMWAVYLLTAQLESYLGSSYWPLPPSAEVADQYEQLMQMAMASPSPIDDILRDRQCMLITIGSDVERYHGLRWKMLEGLWLNVPAVLDILQFIHGPWQGCHHHAQHFLVFHHHQEHQRQLIERMSALLQPQHTLTTLESPWPAPLDLLAFDAQLNGWICAYALAHPQMRWSDWPGYKADGPLYHLSSRTQVGLPTDHHD